MEYSAKCKEMIEKLYSLLIPEAMGKDFQEALKNKDGSKLLRTAARYFRNRPDWEITHLLPSRDYDPKTAENARNNLMREVNIDWQFTDGHIHYLFNATSVTGPLNHEWLWQLNRHNFWCEMACAYHATGEESYAQAFQTQLVDWVEQTSPTADYNAPGSAWRTIESGIRLMDSWMIAFSAFRNSPSLEDESLLLMLSSMHQQADHLIHHFTMANWLMMESNGAYTFGSLFPEFKDAKRIRTISGERLAKELEQQLLPDGMQYELSPDYHSVVYTCATNLYFIAQALGLTEELPQSYRPLLKKAADAYVALATPTFTQPRTNDCYTLSTNCVINRALRIFPEEPTYQYVSSDRSEGQPPTGETSSRFLPYAGLCAMRSGWDKDATYLCFDVGPLGMAHIHQDMLNFHLYKGTQELIFDDGGGQYEISRAREYGLSAADHNTVLVDGLGQNRTVPLKCEEPIDCGWISNQLFDYAYGVYDGEFGPERAHLASHRRQIRFCKPDFFVLRDDLASLDEKEHAYEILFHLDTLKIRKVDEYPGAYCSDYEGNPDVLLVPVDGTEEMITVVSGQTEPEYRGWFVGRNESNLHKATTIGRKITSKKQYTFTTLLFVLEKGQNLPEIQKAGKTIKIFFEGSNYEIDTENLNR